MSNRPIEWVDTAIDSKERQILTSEQLHVPGIRMFGHHNAIRAISPLQLHYHKDCFELTYIVQGNIRFSVGGKVYPISGGDLYLTFPDEVHDTGSFPMSLHQMYWFQINLDDPEGFLYMDQTAVQLLREHLSQLSSRIIKLNAEEANDILSKVFRYFRSSSMLNHIQGAQLLGFFLLQLVEYSELNMFHLTPDISRATDYIMDHIREALTIEDLAQVAILSVSRFKQKFKTEMGTSPRSFINFHKVELAKQLLLEGHSVTDVAMELSFSSSNYFSSVFRRYTYFSPSEYLQRMANAKSISPGNEDFREDEPPQFQTDEAPSQD